MFFCRKYGEEGLPGGRCINVKLKGSAGQSFGAFMTRGVNVTLEGDANDYVGKSSNFSNKFSTINKSGVFFYYLFIATSIHVNYFLNQYTYICTHS